MHIAIHNNYHIHTHTHTDTIGSFAELFWWFTSGGSLLLSTRHFPMSRDLDHIFSLGYETGVLVEKYLCMIVIIKTR